MTPKDKAEELFDKYSFLKDCFIPSIHEQKQGALIAVDEILNVLWNTHKNEEAWRYHLEVKQEIQKL